MFRSGFPAGGKHAWNSAAGETLATYASALLSQAEAARMRRQVTPSPAAAKFLELTLKP